MKSVPPTPTRAPDNQFRKMHDQLKDVRDTSLVQLMSDDLGAVRVPASVLQLLQHRGAAAVHRSAGE